MQNEARLIPGWAGNAIEFQGLGEHVTMGDQSNTCFGNLEKCNNGLTVILYLKFKEMIENGYVMSTGPYSIYYRNGKTHATFSTPTKTWTVSTDKIKPNQWQRVALSWDDTKGLSMYIDKKQVAATTEFRSHSEKRITDYNVYLGRPNNDITNGVYANVDIDEMEVWYANRDHLLSFGLLDSGKSLKNP